MGNSDKILIPFYEDNIKPIISSVALLGFTNNNLFDGDLYDIQLKNWDINSKWILPKLYNTLICTRCAYFAKDPKDFMIRCHKSLNNSGLLYVDWGLGDHWRFKKFKVGWVKDGEQEYAYKNDNFLWSTVWDDNFANDQQYIDFEKSIYNYGYTNLKEAIFNEVPSILNIKEINSIFSINYKMIFIDKPHVQLYILLKCEKI